MLEMPLKLNCKDQFDCALKFLEVCDLGYKVIHYTKLFFVGKNCIYYTIFISYKKVEKNALPC